MKIYSSKKRKVHQLICLRTTPPGCFIHPDWGEQVIAVVVPKPGTKISTDDLDAHCLANIARFKRPKEYRFVESLPKNNYGKVLKTELRRMLVDEDDAAG